MPERSQMSALARRIFDPKGACVLPEGQPWLERPFREADGTFTRRLRPPSGGRNILALDKVVPRPPKGYVRHHTCGRGECLNRDHIVVVSTGFHRKLHTKSRRYDSHSVRERLQR